MQNVLSQRRLLSIGAVLLLYVGILSSCVFVIAALIFCALSGRWILGTSMALLVDLLWGQPTGALHVFSMPCAFLVLILSAARFFLLPYVRAQTAQFI